MERSTHALPLCLASTVPLRQRERAEAYFLFAALTAAPTMSFVEGAAAIVLGTGFFGFLASRFLCFFSVPMTASSWEGCIIARGAIHLSSLGRQRRGQLDQIASWWAIPSSRMLSSTTNKVLLRSRASQLKSWCSIIAGPHLFG